MGGGGRHYFLPGAAEHLEKTLTEGKNPRHQIIIRSFIQGALNSLYRVRLTFRGNTTVLEMQTENTRITQKLTERLMSSHRYKVLQKRTKHKHK